ncbi:MULTISPECIES: MauE/DoxX family redox-associated membrane protein [unclassified Pedobacter]|uniref:MauE/DoxX family redox-associated membrane protein n=1 Tax=unclassified Pedobacter TaxID=2628915 RepID=UPI001D60DB25|nr:MULTISPECIES: MauE/DoxX family redox-associated membrane protein [unclassified Pedobacter]CAH0266872.1 hypothetical protein SRABI36_03622 [Pedobacter sp. Bi36]CAH0293128.1 hypothetical protein SRABI126_04116 [Pedobacter sp. Bi126]
MKERFLIFGVSALIILWVYTACSKLLEFNTFKYQLHMQHMPWGIENILIIALPVTELLAAYLLAKKTTRYKGLWLSVSLLLLFTIYIGLILLGVFNKAPCSCGGVLSFLTWNTHLLFNVIFLSLNSWVLYEIHQQRKEALKII